jgi:hypothetical protein
MYAVENGDCELKARRIKGKFIVHEFCSFV